MILTLSTLLRGSNREKLKWIFSRLYDLNGNGFITKREFFDIISAIHDLVGVSKQVSILIHSVQINIQVGIFL